MENIDEIKIDNILKKASVSELVSDFKSACRYYEMAALKGDRRSFNKLMTYYSKEKYNKDLRKAIYWGEKYISSFSELINKMRIEYRLGNLYKECYSDTEENNIEDRNKSIYWFYKAYEHRTEDTNIRHLIKIGVYLYQLGDYRHSFTVLDSLKDSCPESTYKTLNLHLGKCYLFGKGVKKDSTKAFNFLQEAANNNSKQAISLLAEFFNTNKK